MLTKSNAIIMGLILESPVNPYEIIRILKEININKWYPIAKQSLYSNIKKLNELGFITGKTVKEGNMPEKTIYSITENGKNELYHTLVEYLMSTDVDIVKFNIGIMFLCHIDKEEATGLLMTKSQIMEQSILSFQKKITSEEQIKENPYNRILIMKYNLNIMRSELECIKGFIENIKYDNEWKNYVSNIIKSKSTKRRSLS